MTPIESARPPHTPEYILNAACRAGIGIVAAVATFLAERDCYICALEQFDDDSTERFFMRAVFRRQAGSPSIEDIHEQFGSGVATRLDMQWKIHDSAEPVRTVLMVSKDDHCLDDLLYRRRNGELNMSITAVVSNHLDLRPMVEREGIRFIFLPVTKENKAQQEARLLEVVEETRAELVILARYMQILSDELARRLAGRCINIHHSFLPGFKGARPYHQAHARGVKVIGATAHYVTADLDEGPIIEQDVERISHRDTPEDLIRKGRDIERRVLARAVRRHLEDRVLLHGAKTVVFED